MPADPDLLCSSAPSEHTGADFSPSKGSEILADTEATKIDPKHSTDGKSLELGKIKISFYGKQRQFG